MKFTHRLVAIPLFFAIVLLEAGQPSVCGQESPPAKQPGRVDPAFQRQIREKYLQSQELPAAYGVTPKNLKEISTGLHYLNLALEILKRRPDPEQVAKLQNGQLSWRVHALPHLGYNELYKEFHKDEPWDSPHNKTLIPKMPKVFGVNESGKTRVHIVSGKGLVFEPDAEFRQAKPDDPAEATLHCVVGAEDTAEIWTKPGALQFDPQAPLKCLGKTGPHFLVSMYNTSVMMLPGDIAPELFTKLVLRADGAAVDLSEIHESPDKLFKAKQPTPDKASDTPQLPAPLPRRDRYDMSYIPPDAFAAFITFPRRFFEHPLARAFQEHTTLDDLKLGGQQGEVVLYALRNHYKSIQSISGISPYTVEQMIVIFDKSVPEVAQRQNRGEKVSPPVGIYVKTATTINPAILFQYLQEDSRRVKIEEHSQVTILTIEQENLAFALLSPTEFALGGPQALKSMIDGSGTTKSRLMTRLENTPERMLIFVADGEPVKAGLKQAYKQLPPTVAPFGGFVMGITELSVTFDLDAPELLQATVQYSNSYLSDNLFGLLDQQWTNLKSLYAEKRKEWVTTVPTLVRFLDQWEKQIQFTNREGTINLMVPRLKDLQQLTSVVDELKAIAPQPEK